MWVTWNTRCSRRYWVAALVVQPLLSNLPTRPPPQMLASFCVVPLAPLGSMTVPALPKLSRGSGALMLWL